MQSVENLLNAGFILLDKPRGPSSHEVTAYVRKLLGVRKTGHAGTLDPQVSGVMVIGINKATKLLRFVVGKEKTYVGVMRIRNPPSNIEIVQKEMNKFIGKIEQIPPLHSAVAKRKRKREIYEFKAIEMDGKNILFRARVEAGTYIRNLCQDVGKAFEGGKMLELRRVAIGNIDEKMLISLSDLQDGMAIYRGKGDSSLIKRLIKPADDMFTLPSIMIKDKAIDSVCRGAPLALSGVAYDEAKLKEGTEVKLRNKEGDLIAIGRVENEKILPKAVLTEVRAGVA
ncbi:MAG: RNA-guided pseudouridylation complex pseudouridine synthase subunit Cbf5 [Candidatus Micrarchaeota archaeon]